VREVRFLRWRILGHRLIRLFFERDWSGRIGCRALQPCKGPEQFRMAIVTILACGFDFFQHLPDGIDHAQESRGDFGIQNELSVS
jgi:hypothetical protein